MDIVNNQWVAGIGAGIISGLVVFWITRFFFSKRDNREYFQKVAAANREVLYAIRPGISEGAMPSEDILKRLIMATARKYNVEEKSMFTATEISSELIKEVMDSAFISTKSKIEFCNKLSGISAGVLEQSSAAEDKYKDDIARKYQRQTSAIMALMTAVMSLFAVTYTLRDGIIGSAKTDIIFSAVVPAVIATGLAASFSVIFAARKTRSSENGKKNTGKNSDEQQ
jgi:hypothetical protein